MMPAKKRIRFIVKNRQLGAAFGEQFIEITAPGAIHQLDRDLELSFANRVEFDQLVKLLHGGGLGGKWFVLITADDRPLEGPPPFQTRPNISHHLLWAVG